MTQIHFNSAFADMTIDQIDKWITLNAERLVGSAIFTQNKSLTSKLVRWAENLGKKEKEKFTPSHTGSIIKCGNNIYVFDMKPLKANKTLLLDYIIRTKDIFAIVLRDFKLDGKMFSTNILEHLGEFYPFMSAVRSAFTKRQSKWRRHCSELHLRELQKQGLYEEINAEITPDELWQILRGNK